MREFLNKTFLNRWIGRDGPTPWPPSSPDITPLEFFLLGYIEDRVYATPVAVCDELKARMQAVVGTEIEDM